MLSAKTLLGAMNEISRTMTSNRQYLIELDQRNGDGDLGISMSDGYAAAHKYLLGTQESDLGKLFVGMAKAFNEAAPSSLGTITSFLMMGMARVLKGHESADAAMLGDAFLAGVERIMEKAGSKPGEKTILDVLEPSARALREHAQEGMATALKHAAQAAREGEESTKNMRAVHGRAAYYGDKTLGLVDGGAVAGRLLFEAIWAAADKM